MGVAVPWAQPFPRKVAWIAPGRKYRQHGRRLQSGPRAEGRIALLVLARVQSLAVFGQERLFGRIKAIDPGSEAVPVRV